MNKDFPLNRFNFTNLIKHIRTEILIPNVITDDETGIEFYGGDSIGSLSYCFQGGRYCIQYGFLSSDLAQVGFSFSHCLWNFNNILSS